MAKHFITSGPFPAGTWTGAQLSSGEADGRFYAVNRNAAAKSTWSAADYLTDNASTTVGTNTWGGQALPGNVAIGSNNDINIVTAGVANWNPAAGTYVVIGRNINMTGGYFRKIAALAADIYFINCNITITGIGATWADIAFGVYPSANNATDRAANYGLTGNGTVGTNGGWNLWGCTLVAPVSSSWGLAASEMIGCTVSAHTTAGSINSTVCNGGRYITADTASSNTADTGWIMYGPAVLSGVSSYKQSYVNFGQVDNSYMLSAPSFDDPNTQIQFYTTNSSNGNKVIQTINGYSPTPTAAGWMSNNGATQTYAGIGRFGWGGGTGQWTRATDGLVNYVSFTPSFRNEVAAGVKNVRFRVNSNYAINTGGSNTATRFPTTTTAGNNFVQSFLSDSDGKIVTESYSTDGTTFTAGNVNMLTGLTSATVRAAQWNTNNSSQSGARNSALAVTSAMRMADSEGVGVPRYTNTTYNYSARSFTHDFNISTTRDTSTFVNVQLADQIGTNVATQSNYISAAAVAAMNRRNDGTITNSYFATLNRLNLDSEYSGTTNNLQGIVYALGRFWSVGVNRTLISSVDGKVWTGGANVLPTPPTGNIYNGIVYGGNTFVACGDGGGIATSPDGVTWTARTSGEATSISYTEVAYGNGTFVVCGTSGRIRYSTDNGVTWTSGNPNTSNTFQCVAYGNGTFVAVGANGIVFTSPAALANTWTEQSSGTTSAIVSVRFLNGQFWAVGAGAQILNSADGVTWNITALSGTNATLSDITYCDGVYIVVGSLGVTGVSPDGTNWTVRTITGRPDFSSLACANNFTVETGQGGKVYTGAYAPFTFTSVAECARYEWYRYTPNAALLVPTDGTINFGAQPLVFNAALAGTLPYTYNSATQTWSFKVSAPDATSSGNTIRTSGNITMSTLATYEKGLCTLSAPTITLPGSSIVRQDLSADTNIVGLRTNGLIAADCTLGFGSNTTLSMDSDAIFSGVTMSGTCNITPAKANQRLSLDNCGDLSGFGAFPFVNAQSGTNIFVTARGNTVLPSTLPAGFTLQSTIDITVDNTSIGGVLAIWSGGADPTYSTTNITGNITAVFTGSPTRLVFCKPGYNIVSIDNPSTNVSLINIQLTPAAPVIHPVGAWTADFGVTVAGAITVNVVDNSTSGLDTAGRLEQLKSTLAFAQFINAARSGGFSVTQAFTTTDDETIQLSTTLMQFRASPQTSQKVVTGISVVNNTFFALTTSVIGLPGVVQVINLNNQSAPLGTVMQSLMNIVNDSDTSLYKMSETLAQGVSRASLGIPWNPNQ